jgi:hypothetical protein
MDARLASLTLIALAPAGCLARQLPGLGPIPAEVGPPVSSYALKVAGKAAGAVHVVSFGAERLPAGPERPALYLHLRLAADNRADDTLWSLDPREQKLLVAGKIVRPTFAEASGRQPILTVGRGGRGTLDVYYPFPDAADPRLALIWRMRRGAGSAGRVTRFARVTSPDTTYAYYQPEPGPQVMAGLTFEAWWWSDYYFWRHGNLWWPCPRESLLSHYPGFTRPAAPDRPSAERVAAEGWRGEAPSPPSTTEPVKSSWRSQGSTVESSGGMAGGVAAGAPSGGGDGKSSWRGGSGP